MPLLIPASRIGRYIADTHTVRDRCLSDLPEKVIPVAHRCPSLTWCAKVYNLHDRRACRSGAPDRALRVSTDVGDVLTRRRDLASVAARESDRLLTLRPLHRLGAREYGTQTGIQMRSSHTEHPTRIIYLYK